MRNPLRRSRKKVFLGGEGMRLLWKLFPQAAFFEVYVPKREGEDAPELPLIIESTETRLVEPYTKMYYRLFTARDAPLRRILVINVNCHPAVSRRVAANLAITLASEDRTTCLIDLDVMEAGLHEVFHESIDPGVVEYLLKGAKIREIVRQTAIPELKFIPSGKTIMDLDEILSLLGWGETLDRILPRDVVGLIYAGSGKSFDLAELMPEIDGTLLLFSSGARIDRWVRKELKKVRRRSEVVGVVWTNPMEFPLRAVAPLPRERHAETVSREEAPVGGPPGLLDARAREDADGTLLEARRREIPDGARFEGGGPEDADAAPVETRGEEAAEGSPPETPPSSVTPEPAASPPRETGTRGAERDELRASFGAPGGAAEPTGEDGDARRSTPGAEERIEPPGGETPETEPHDDTTLRDDRAAAPGGRLLFTSSEAEPARKGPAWFALVGIAIAVLVAWTFLEWRGVLGPGAGPETVATVPAPRSIDRERAPGPSGPGAGASEAVVSTEAPGGEVEGTTPGEAVAGAGEAGRELPWSIVLGSYRTPESATSARDALRRAGFGAQVVPVELPDGLGLWHRVMVGELGDEESARARLGEILAGSGLPEGRIVNAPWAYLTGMYQSSDDADVARTELEAAGFDAYSLRTPGEDGVFSIYVGAFEDEAQAGPLGASLRAHGIDSELVRRSGTGS